MANKTIGQQLKDLGLTAAEWVSLGKQQRERILASYGKQFSAVWETEQLVHVYRGGLHIANVVHVPVDGGWRMGWKVQPLTTAHKSSRTFSDNPAMAIWRYCGKRVNIKAKE